jgi:RNA polymerase sigma-70 factor, ECF subfamily
MFAGRIGMVYSDCKSSSLQSRAFMINDEQAIKGLKGLDRQVIGAIYDQYFSEVYRYVQYRVGDPIQSEDIASDVFLRLIEASQAGKGPQSNLKSWLIATASHIVMDQFRRKYRRSEETLPETMPDEGPQPSTEVDQREQRQQVKDAYQSLTAEQQEVIALRFGQGYSIEETAAIMNRNVNAVKALQFRAFSALSREIGEVEYE